MTGIDDLFREYSQPDEFTSQHRLELFALMHLEQRDSGNTERAMRSWRKRVATKEGRAAFNASRRDWARDYMRRKRAANPDLVKRERTAHQARMAKLRQDKAYRDAENARDRARRAAKRAT